MNTINTIHGEMDENLLEKREGHIDNDVEYTTWVEYWYNNELVHRSAHVTVKELPPLFGELGE
jgi:hypothetical protein